MENPRSTTFAITAKALVVLANILFVASLGLADDNSPRPLPDGDRRVLDEYLGPGVVGEAIAAPILAHGLNDLISLHDGLAWRVRVIAGKGAGSNEVGSAALLNRPGGSSFRFDTGDGRNVLFGQLDQQGNLLSYASQDVQQGVISRFTPAQPIFLAAMTPGEIRRMTSHISVADLSQPDVQTHSGFLDIEFQYVGAYRLHVPAGILEAELFKTRLTGKVGPATVQDTIYRFFAKDSEPVAEVETNDVSALLIYHEKTRVGKVLVETINR
jgi:hypothetical protein